MTPADFGCRCTECPFAVKGKDGALTHQSDFVLPDGPSQPAGIVWCDLPSYDDARRGVPMAPNSNTGKEWQKSLQQAGLEREALLHVPATACKKPASAKESQISKAVTACAPMRQAAKDKVDSGVPSLVLGQYAWAALTGKKEGHADWRGFVDNNTCVTFRPDLAYFWAPHEWASFDIDVRRFGRLIRGELEPAPKIVIDGEFWAQVEARAIREGWIAFDIETMPENPEEPWTGKDPTRARLRTLSFGWEDEGFAFLWADQTPEVQAAVRRLLADQRVVKWGQNIVWFDNRVLARYGMPVTPFEDTRDLRRAVSSTSRLSLAYQATQYTDAPPWKSSQDAESEDVSK